MQNVEPRSEQISEPRLLIAATVAVTLRSFLLPIARHFRERGWRVDAIAQGAASDEACLGTFDRVWEATWSRHPLHPSNLAMASRLRNLTEEHGYDIVHVHTPVAGFVTRFALRQLRREDNLQVLYTAHGFHFHPNGGALRNAVYEHAERAAGKWTDTLIVINRHDLEAAQQKQLLEPGRLRFMPGIGVDRVIYGGSWITESDVSRLHEELGVSAETPLLLMVAEFTERKRHADAVRAFARVTHPHARLLLAGSGPRMLSIRELAARLGISDRVHFLGQRIDIPVLMKACRALILPSSQEGLPRCVLEAMSMGIPVIGSRIRGTSELLDHGAGLLTEVGDVGQLAYAMQLLLDDTATARAMGKIGRRQSEAYDVERILCMHEAVYEEALALRRNMERTARPNAPQSGAVSHISL